MNDSFHSRRRWPWVLLLVAALIVLLLVGSFGIWSTGARRRLDHEVATLKAAGEPIELADFVVKDVPNADNAVIDLRAAAASVDETTRHFKDYDKLEPAIPLTDTEMRGIRDVVKDNATAFADIERAVTKKGVDWQIPFKSPAIQILLPDLSHMRTLGNLIGHRALLEHQQGDDAAALRDLDHLLFLADAVDQQPVIVSHLVATGIRAIATDRLEQIAPAMKIGMQGGAASPEQANALIAELLDEKSANAGLHRGFQGERALELDTARCVADGRLTLNGLTTPGGSSPSANVASAAFSFVGHPMFLSDGELMIRQTTKTIAAADQSQTWPAYVASAPPIPPAVNNEPLRHVLARIILPSFGRAVQTHYRSAAERRMSAIALAIACWRADHGGNFPKSLDELVPAYLPSIPADPLSAAGKIKYVAATTQPIVYSVGEDGIDNGGSETVASKRANPSKWDMQDAVTHLTAKKRPAPSSEDAPLSGVDAESLSPVTQPASQPATSPSDVPGVSP